MCMTSMMATMRIEEDDNEYDPAIYNDDDNGSADDINSRTKMKGETAASA